MFLDQSLAQVFQICKRMFGDEQLIRISPSFPANRYRFASPYQLCSTCSETLPAAHRQFGGPAVGCAVPAFHRVDCEAIADAETVRFDRLSKRRSAPSVQIRVARYRDPIHSQVISKCVDILKTCDARNLAGHTTMASFSGTRSFFGRTATTAAPAKASPMSNRKPVSYVPR